MPSWAGVLVEYWVTGGAEVGGEASSDDVPAQILAALSLGHLGLEAKAEVPDQLTIALSNTNLSTNAAAAVALPAIDLSATPC